MFVFFLGFFGVKRETEEDETEDGRVRGAGREERWRVRG